MIVVTIVPMITMMVGPVPAVLPRADPVPSQQVRVILVAEVELFRLDGKMAASRQSFGSTPDFSPLTSGQPVHAVWHWAVRVVDMPVDLRVQPLVKLLPVVRLDAQQTFNVLISGGRGLRRRLVQDLFEQGGVDFGRGLSWAGGRF